MLWKTVLDDPQKAPVMLKMFMKSLNNIVSYNVRLDCNVSELRYFVYNVRFKYMLNQINILNITDI